MKSHICSLKIMKYLNSLFLIVKEKILGWALSVAADWQQSHYEKHGTANYAGVNIGFNF